MKTNPIALVTGGSRGIGRAIVTALAARGSDVVLTYREAEGAARETVAAVEKLGRRAVALRLDVGHAPSFDAFASEVGRTLERVWDRPRLDHLVLNAGVPAFGALADTNEAAFDAAVAANFKGPFFLTQKLLSRLSDGGRIVHVSSGVTRYAYPGLSVYAATKAATETFARVLAVELGPRRITVNVVAPGGIETDFAGGVMRDPDLQKTVIAETPLGRIGQPEDVAGIVAMLVAPESGWITGQRIEATGGYRL